MRGCFAGVLDEKYRSENGEDMGSFYRRRGCSARPVNFFLSELGNVLKCERRNEAVAHKWLKKKPGKNEIN